MPFFVYHACLAVICCMQIPFVGPILIAHIGETIPIRLFLGGFDLTPTFREVNKKYSTRYYLSLVLIDEGKLSCNVCFVRYVSTEFFLSLTVGFWFG